MYRKVGLLLHADRLPAAIDGANRGVYAAPLSGVPVWAFTESPEADIIVMRVRLRVYVCHQTWPSTSSRCAWNG